MLYVLIQGPICLNWGLEWGVIQLYKKKELNDFQKEIFETYERNSVTRYLEKYGSALKNIPQGGEIKILDIGGGSSNFAVELCQYFSELGTKADITVLDITRYSSWEQYGDFIRFIEGSAFDVENLFEKETFDIIFVNVTFHHLVQPSWRKTLAGFSFMLDSIHRILKPDGTLCIFEIYYEILFLKGFSSWLIHALSTIRIPTVAKIVRRMGSKSAGIGVCFISINKWQKIFKQAGYKITEIVEDPVHFMKKRPIKEQFFYFILNK